MDDIRFGTVVRLVRKKRGWRQRDLSDRCGVSQSGISRIEHGRLGSQSLASLRAVGAALDIRVDLVPRWHAGDLDRLLNAAHSNLHEAVATTFRDRWPGWALAPEVSFAVYGERGVFDILAWNAVARAVLVIELKTEIVDINELLGTLDRKRRLAPVVVRERGWDPATISRWLIVSSSRTSRRRVLAHEAMLGNALPDDGPAIERWLPNPQGSVNGLSFWTDMHGAAGSQASRSIRRVRVAGDAAPERGDRSTTFTKARNG